MIVDYLTWLFWVDNLTDGMDVQEVRGVWADVMAAFGGEGSDGEMRKTRAGRMAREYVSLSLSL